ncbi:MAG: protein kinase domain-containing protein [Polyangiales bacterium]
MKNPSEPPSTQVTSSRPPQELSAIATFGRYELVGRLAFGGMAEIFLARESAAGGASRYLVIKRVLPHVADDEQFVQMFFDEARLAMQLNHPNICHIYEFGEKDDHYFIAMEWINGQPLGQAIRRARVEGGIPAHIGAKVVAQVADALHYAHRAKDQMGRPMGIVHRDVSPQNIMVSYDGAVKLLDFGIAKASTHATKTQAGVVKGKFAYMSPQQCLGQDIDGRADIFALGICLYEVLTGKGLYHRKSEYETMRAVIDGEVPSIRDVVPDLPVELDAITQKALAKKPEDRFQTAGEMHEALEQWIATSGNVVSAAKIESFMEELYADEIRRGPLVDSTPFGMSLHKQGARSEAPSQSSGSGQVASSSSAGGHRNKVASIPIDIGESEQPRKGKQRLALLGGVAALVAAAAIGGAMVAAPGDDASEAAADTSEDDGEGAGSAGSPTQDEDTPQDESAPEAPPQEKAAATETEGETQTGQTPAAAEPTRGTVLIESSPEGAKIKLGGRQFEERTPTIVEDIEPGKHVVLLARPGFRTWRGQVEVVAGEEAKVEADLDRARREPAAPPGHLSVNTRPWSKVYVGGRSLGTTPIGGVQVPSGSVRLRIVDRDGRTHHRTVKVEPGEEARLFFDLTK